MIVTQKLPVKPSKHVIVIIARYNRYLGGILEISDLTFGIEIKQGLIGFEHYHIQSAPTYH